MRIDACVVCPQMHTHVIFVIHSNSAAALSITLPPVCQPKSEVQHVVLIVVWLRAPVIIILVLKNDMAGGARQRTLACACSPAIAATA